MVTHPPSLADELDRLSTLVTDALDLWDLPSDAAPSLLNVSENVTYLIEAPGNHKTVLRVHRPGYHSINAIACELAWMSALQKSSPVTPPRAIPGRNGALIQQAEVPDTGTRRHMVLFDYIDGTTPDESSDLIAGFGELGTLAAQCHSHVLTWQRPASFERMTWDLDAVFGPAPTWGHWRDAPGVTPAIETVLARVETRIRHRLSAYGSAPTRFNLIHADMRLANLIIGHGGTRLIDFDDCGFGWFMYDFAAAVSFIEDDPRLPDLKAAWLEGYQRIRPLDPADLAEIDTLVMLRRLALLAWIGSHIEAPEPQALAQGFAQTSADLGQKWLDGL